MARVGKHADPRRVQKNLKGRAIVHTWRGQLVMQSWPRKRGPSKNPTEIWWRSTWGTAAQMANRPHPMDRAFAEAWSAGTKFRPEDLLTAAALGQLFEIEDPSGTIKGSMLTMGGNPQQTLDLITTETGSILYRSPDGWIGVRPGQGGKVLESLAGDRLGWADKTPATGPADPSPTRLVLTADRTNQDLVTAYTVDWDAADYDFGGRWAASPNPERITFGPADVGRIALVFATARMRNVGANEVVLMQLRLFDAAGNQLARAQQRNPDSADDNVLGVSMQTPLLQDGDYLTLMLIAEAGGNATLFAGWIDMATTMVN